MQGSLGASLLKERPRARPLEMRIMERRRGAGRTESEILSALRQSWRSVFIRKNYHKLFITVITGNMSAVNQWSSGLPTCSEYIFSVVRCTFE